MVGSGGRKGTGALLSAIEGFYGDKGYFAAAGASQAPTSGSSRSVAGSRPAAPQPKQTVVLVVCGGSTSAELVGCLAGLGGTDKISLSGQEEARFTALSAAGQVDPAALGPEWKKVDEDKGLVQQKMPGEIDNGGLVCFVKAPSLVGPPQSAGDAFVKEMVAKGKEMQSKVRERLEEKKLGSEGVSDAVLADALKHGGLEVTAERAAGALASLTPAGRSAISQYELLSVWDTPASPPLADVEARIKECASAADLVIVAVDGTNGSLRESALAASLLQDEVIKAKAKPILWLSEKTCSSIAKSAGAPFAECAPQVSALVASTAASFGVPAASVALASSSVPSSLTNSLADEVKAVSAAVESHSLSPLLALVLSQASKARDAIAGTSAAAKRASSEQVAAMNRAIDALAACATKALVASDGWGSAALAFAGSLEELKVEKAAPKVAVDAKAERVRSAGEAEAPSGPSIAEQADRMLARILSHKRPKPSLEQGKRRPFRAGVVQPGYEALVVGKAAPGAEEGAEDAAYGSEEWFQCPKTYVTDWGRRYVGVSAHKHWLSACEGGAEGAPVKKSLVGGARDVPLPVGMRGNVLVFGFILCEWEVTTGQVMVSTGELGPDGQPLRDEEGEEVKAPVERVVFKMWPVGKAYSWFTQARLKQTKGSPTAALAHLAQAVDEKLRLGDAAKASAKATDAASLFGLRDKSVQEFLREKMTPVNTKTRSEADEIRRKERTKKAAEREEERMKKAERDLSDLEGVVKEHKEAIEALKVTKPKTVFTPRLAKERKGLEEEVVTAEERDRRLDDRRAQFLRACQISLLVQKSETRSQKSR